MKDTTHRALRLLKASIVLATTYAVGLGVLLALLAIVADLNVFAEKELLYGLLPFAIPLGVAFVVLAIARRMGFVLLWLVLVGVWCWMVLRFGTDPGTLLYS